MTDALLWSLGEVEAACRKAARGAGAPWGVAEEAGRAARWLAARGLPGPALVADLLRANDRVPHDDLAPVAEEGVWRAPSGRLCPLVVGAAICDRAAEVAAGRVVETDAIGHPLLLAPQADAAAHQSGIAVVLEWDGAVIEVDADGLSIAGEPAALLVAEAPRAVLRRRDASARGTDPRLLGAPCAADREFNRESGRTVAAEVARRLAALAARTYAPETEAGRLTGAGAGLSDD